MSKEVNYEVNLPKFAKKELNSKQHSHITKIPGNIKSIIFDICINQMMHYILRLGKKAEWYIMTR